MPDLPTSDPQSPSGWKTQVKQRFPKSLTDLKKEWQIPEPVDKRRGPDFKEHEVSPESLSRFQDNKLKEQAMHGLGKAQTEERHISELENAKHRLSDSAVKVTPNLDLSEQPAYLKYLDGRKGYTQELQEYKQIKGRIHDLGRHMWILDSHDVRENFMKSHPELSGEQAEAEFMKWREDYKIQLYNQKAFLKDKVWSIPQTPKEVMDYEPPNGVPRSYQGSVRSLKQMVQDPSRVKNIEGKHVGSAGKVFFVTSKDGTKAVYKPSDGNLIDSGFSGLREKELPEAQRELATHYMDKIMGTDVVPPVVEGDLGFGPGHVQLWTNGKTHEHEDTQDAFSKAAEKPSFRNMRILDWLTANGDRHQGNYIWGDDGRIHAIDHGLSFVQRNPSVFSGEAQRGYSLDLKPEELEKVRRLRPVQLWHKLKDMKFSDEKIADILARRWVMLKHKGIGKGLVKKLVGNDLTFADRVNKSISSIPYWAVEDKLEPLLENVSNRYQKVIRQRWRPALKKASAFRQLWDPRLDVPPLLEI